MEKNNALQGKKKNISSLNIYPYSLKGQKN